MKAPARPGLSLSLCIVRHRTGRHVRRWSVVICACRHSVADDKSQPVEAHTAGRGRLLLRQITLRQERPRRSGAELTRVQCGMISESSASAQLRTRGLVPKKKSPAGRRGYRCHAWGPTCNKPHPLHVRGPTRPNWGGGKPLFGGITPFRHDALR